jgi:drug/metabolite transporter (DMT)-like permease
VTAWDDPSRARDVLLIGGTLCALTTLLPIICYTTGLRGLPAGEASILATWPPLMTIMVAAVVLDEVPAIGPEIGTVAVILGLLILAVTGGSRNRKPERGGGRTA